MDERDFWMEQRAGLLRQVEAIERQHLPDLYEERQAFRKWRDDFRREAKIEKKRLAVT